MFDRRYAETQTRLQGDLRSAYDRQSLLLRLGDRMRVLDDASAIMAETAEALGGFLRLDRTGFFRVTIVDVPVGRPEKDQVRVRVEAASVNPVDWKIREGALKMMTGSKFPRGMGQDFAGIVEAVGPEVRRVKVGDEVFGAMEMKDAAAFSEVIVTPERTMTVLPNGLALDQAAALGTVGQTAWTAIVDVGKVKAGQRILVNGCLGGVGRCAVQIARMLGAEVSGTCDASGIDEARRLGVGDPADYRGFDANRSAGRFDIVLDTAGNLTVAQCSGDAPWQRPRPAHQPDLQARCCGLPCPRATSWCS